MSAQQPWHLLHGYLAWTRSHVLSAVADLDDGELRAPRVPSGWSMAELVHHLAVDVERFWFLAVMAADPEAVGYFEEATASGWTIPAHLAPSGVLDLYGTSAPRPTLISRRQPQTPPRDGGRQAQTTSSLRISRQCLCTRSLTPRPTPATWTSSASSSTASSSWTLAGRRAPINP